MLFKTLILTLHLHQPILERGGERERKREEKTTVRQQWEGRTHEISVPNALTSV